MSIATLLSQHHKVTAVDIIPEKVELINNKKSPIQDEYIEKYLAEKELDLTATLDAKEAYSDADFVVIAAPTNYDSKKNFFDTSAVEAVIKLVIEYNPDAYAGAIIPMQVIMPTLLFIGLTNIMGIQMLVPLGKEKVVLYSEIAGMIVDIILNALLIPKMASTGAAIGTLAAEIAVFIVQYVALRGIIKEAYRQVHYVAIGSSVLAGGVLAVLIKRMQWGSFMTL